jgi:hypothetical protein
VQNELGALIASEVGRAESDLAAFRERSIKVLGLSSALVTLITGLLAFSSNRADSLSTGAKWLLGFALGSYVLSASCALLIQRPRDTTIPTAAALLKFAEEKWDAETWEQDVAVVLAEYLVSLRKLDEEVARQLLRAIRFELLGVFLTGALALAIVV